MTWDRIFVPLLVVATSGLVWAFGVRRGLPTSALGRAAVRMLEAAGLAAGFLLLNLVLGAIAVIGMRSLAQGFVSFYAMDDVVLPLAALAQALVYQAWRGEKRPDSAV